MSYEKCNYIEVNFWELSGVFNSYKDTLYFIVINFNSPKIMYKKTVL